MRIAISTETNHGLDSRVAHHFGRCPYYAFIDVEGNEVQDVRIVPNPFAGGHQPGQVPQYIFSQGAEVMLSGGMGYRAIALFERIGVQVATGAQGTLRETLTRFLGGELREAAPCHDSVEHRNNGRHHHHHHH